jgi:regulation of enolase protein 1 (concanavalin A-like superfamily)
LGFCASSGNSLHFLNILDIMKSALWFFFTIICATMISKGAELVFKDDFKGRLEPGWTWIRENPNGWRTTETGLKIQVEPGNMWGPANNAKNILVRPLPYNPEEELIVSVTVENRPTEQYEQVNLVWYYDDGHMVKLGQELVDGQLSIVMGREEADRARTIAIVPIQSEVVEVRYRAKGDQLLGQFKVPGTDEWQEAGSCSMPVRGQPQASIQAYQGPGETERWARITNFRIHRVNGDSVDAATP